MTDAMVKHTRSALTQSVLNTTIAVEPVLGQTVLSLEDVARLQVGDIVTLGSKHDMPIDIRVGGVPRFTGLPGKIGEHSSVQIISLIQD
jgi:flagellar motor switch protein FliM